MRLNSNNELVSVACLIDEVMFIFELTGNDSSIKTCRQLPSKTLKRRVYVVNIVKKMKAHGPHIRFELGLDNLMVEAYRRESLRRASHLSFNLWF
jgi:hypothetical protein